MSPNLDTSDTLYIGGLNINDGRRVINDMARANPDIPLSKIVDIYLEEEKLCAIE